MNKNILGIFIFSLKILLFFPKCVFVDFIVITLFIRWFDSNELNSRG